MKENQVRIIVELEDRRHCLFRLASPSLDQSEHPDLEPKHWFLKKLEAAYETAMRAIHGAESGLLLWLKKLIHYLESKIGPEEAMLRQLRKADVVEVAYPPQYQERWVRRLFRRFIRWQVHHHERWLLVNFLMLPVTGAMMVLPGPNVFFGWNAFRLVSHYLAREGGKRVQRGLCEVHFVPDQLSHLSVVRGPWLETRQDGS
ncbi:MAG: hypothetical protein HY314_08650 [Acidobacteria bacterium]|nr:hypothetical protein [Acidobacteriota bacterium]